MIRKFYINRPRISSGMKTFGILTEENNFEMDRKRYGKCYRCGNRGHYANNCGKKVDDGKMMRGLEEQVRKLNQWKEETEERMKYMEEELEKCARKRGVRRRYVPEGKDNRKRTSKERPRRMTRKYLKKDNNKESEDGEEEKTFTFIDQTEELNRNDY